MAAKSISIEKPGKQNRARLTESIESEELAQALIRSAGTGIYIVQEGKFQYVNSLFQELTGYTQEELLGTYSLNLVHPDDRQIVRKKAIENLKGQQSPFPYEYRFIKKDGNILWVLERVTSTEYRGKRAAVGSFMDIAERKHMEEALKESEERYRDLFENANDLIQSVNPSGKFTYVNRKWLEVLEYTKDEVENLTLGDVLRRDQIPHCMELFKRVCSGEDVTGAETVFVSKSGKEIYVEGNVNPRFQDGEFVATQGIFRDITERKRMEEVLQESERHYRLLSRHCKKPCTPAPLSLSPRFSQKN